MSAFDRLSPFLQEYIYRSGWAELRAIQTAACEVIFESDDHLLLASGTASGKTEAAFFPALTEIAQNPPASVGILYVAPLKALINDQYDRLQAMLQEGDIPVCKWHGDAQAAAKRRLLSDPRGVLQITPESLESLMMLHRADSARLFSDLRFVIIDEVHHFMGSPRGVQLLCLLERVASLCGSSPRRIGLSATLGDYGAARQWLASGTNRNCQSPIAPSPPKKLRMGMKRFLAADEPDADQSPDYYQCLYALTEGRKAILFANSRSEAEEVIAHLRKLARRHHAIDAYRVHHASVSASLREETERAMKEAQQGAITAATMTLELGIDIGALDCVVQLGAPLSVSSLVQRVGRCGRKGQTSDLLFVLLEREERLDLERINWPFIKACAIIKLATQDKWIEPARLPALPYALAYHQTVSCLYAQGEMSAPALAQTILSLTPFRQIPKEDYVQLLRHWLATEHLQKTERGGLLLGEAAERNANHYSFFAVFEAPTEYQVYCGDQLIGTIMGQLSPGARFALAGRSWLVLESDEQDRAVRVRAASGDAEGVWQSSFSCAVHEKILQKMREVLEEGARYRYMDSPCAQRLDEMRAAARQAGFLQRLVVPLSGDRFALFPWAGSGALHALSCALAARGLSGSICPDDMTPVYLLVRAPGGQQSLERALRSIARLDAPTFELPEGAQVSGKFNEYIPKSLLEKQYLTDFLDWPQCQDALRRWMKG